MIRVNKKYQIKKFFLKIRKIIITKNNYCQLKKLHLGVKKFKRNMIILVKHNALNKRNKIQKSLMKFHIAIKVIRVIT